MKIKETELIYLTMFSWKTVSVIFSSQKIACLSFCPIIDPTFLLLCHNYYILRNCAYVLTSIILLLFWKRNYIQSLNFQFCRKNSEDKLKETRSSRTTTVNCRKEGNEEKIVQLLLGVWLEKKMSIFLHQKSAQHSLEHTISSAEQQEILIAFEFWKKYFLQKNLRFSLSHLNKS